MLRGGTTVGTLRLSDLLQSAAVVVALLPMDLPMQPAPLVGREVAVEISMDQVLTEPKDKGTKAETKLATFQAVVAAVVAAAPVLPALTQ
jgi:hypothetical protein